MDQLQHLKNVYVGLRHGQSEGNVAQRIVSDPARGLDAYGLTPEGRAQVRRALEERFEAGSLDGAVRVVSSDFARARETAEVAREVLGAGPVVLRPELRERWFGVWEGQDTRCYERVWADDEVNPDHTEGKVESVRAVLARAAGLVRELDATGEGQTFLLVSHGDTLQILLTGFLGLPLESHRQRVPWEPGEVRELNQVG